MEGGAHTAYEEIKGGRERKKDLGKQRFFDFVSTFRFPPQKMRVTKIFFFETKATMTRRRRDTFFLFLVWEKCASVGLSSAAVEAFGLDQDITLQYRN